MSLRAVNLNLLPVLGALLRERNVSRAAAAVGVSQPAVSRALAQLRGLLKDPLLVPSGRGFALTTRAEAMVETVDRLCLELDAVLQPDVFEPAALVREFVVASSDYASILMVPRLAPRMLSQAPGVTVRFAEVVPYERLSAQRGADFAVVPATLLDAHMASGGRAAPLFHDEFVPVVATTHPLAGRSPSPAEIDAYPHVAFSAGNQRIGPSESEESLIGRRPSHVLALVQHFGALPLLALSTGSVAVMPRRLAESMQAYMDIVVLDEPEPRSRVHLHLAWSARFDNDAAHRWCRDLIIEVMTNADPVIG